MHFILVQNQTSQNNNNKNKYLVSSKYLCHRISLEFLVFFLEKKIFSIGLLIMIKQMRDVQADTGKHLSKFSFFQY